MNDYNTVDNGGDVDPALASLAEDDKAPEPFKSFVAQRQALRAEIGTAIDHDLFQPA